MNSLAQLISNSANKHKNRVAVKIQEVSITYKELLDRANQVAVALIRNGANKDPVGLVGQRHISSYIGLLGILLADCWYVPINPKLSHNKIISILSDSKIKFLVGDRGSFFHIEDCLQDKTCSIINKKIIPVGKAPIGKKWIDEDYLNSISEMADVGSIMESSLAYVMYTSGSTGNSKGVQVTNGNVLAWINNMSLLFDCKPGFIASQNHDLSFDFSVSDIFNTWSNGGVLCVLPEEDRLYPVDFIVREKIEFWSAVPTLLRFIDRMGGLKENSFPSIRHSIFCGEPFSIRLAEQWSLAAPNSTVENMYGPTEATVFLTRYQFRKGRPINGRNGILPVGEPFPGHQVEVISDNGDKKKRGEDGELVYKGPQISNGYLNDQEKTDSVFVKFDWDPTGDIWYKSGDLGFYNENGELECLGRNDNQIKIGGRRIEIGEIEAALSRFPLLQDAVVVVIKDKNQSVTDLIAFTMNEICKDDLNKIRQESTQFIEKVFFPKNIITIDEFPRTSNGKIDRTMLALMAKNQ